MAKNLKKLENATKTKFSELVFVCDHSFRGVNPQTGKRRDLSVPSVVVPNRCAMMYLSRSRCSATAMLLSFSAFLLLLVTVRGHAIPGSALTLVEPPQHGNLPYSDSSSASELYQPQRDSRQMDLAEPPYSVSEIIRSKRWKLSQIVPPAASQGRSRINNRSMTPLVDEQGRELRDEELEVNRQLEEQDQYDRYDVVGDDYSDDGEEQTALQVRRSGTVVNAAEENDDSISGALARAARGTDIEEYFWKYVIDSGE